MEKIFELSKSWEIPNNIVEEFESKILSFELHTLLFYYTLIVHIVCLTSFFDFLYFFHALLLIIIPLFI